MTRFGVAVAGEAGSTGLNYYSYDGEGRVCATQTLFYSGGTVAYGYLYDAEGRRVAKGTVTPAALGSAPSCSLTGFQLVESYVLGQGGENLTTLSWSGGASTWQRTNVYGEGKLIASYDAAGEHFHLSDPLGTRRVQTNSAGEAELDCQSLPFGDNLNCFPDPSAPGNDQDEDATGSLTSIHFTGKERDAESGLDYFGARYYGSSMGRFFSPDPSGLNYADINNPQSFNLYSYALNNPLKFVDPTGLYCDYSDHNDPASGFDQSQFDYNSNSGECGTNGGQWVNDAYTQNGADVANRPQYSVSAIGTPPAPGTDPDFDIRVAYDTQWLQAQNPSPTGDPSLTLAIAVMSQGIPKVCAVGVTATLRKNSVGVSASGSSVGATVNGQSTSGYTPQSSGVDMRSASPLFKSVPVGVYLSPGDPRGNTVSAVSADATIKKVGVTAYVILGTYTPNLSDPQNCP